MPVYKNISGVVTKAKAVRFLTANGWKYAGIRYGSSLVSCHHLIKISTAQENFNLKTYLGNPSGPVTALVIIDSGITVGATTTANAAFDTGALAAGSYVRIINKGNIYGMGGAGGNGGNTTNPTFVDGSVGSIGGNAINIQCRTDIDNYAYVFSGGGGGGGAAGMTNGSGAGYGGSSGGGAQGYGTSGHGSPGISSGWAGNITGDSYRASASGNQSGPGVGGGIIFVNDGGIGGAWGVAGNAASRIIGSGGTNGAGGAAGKAVSLNGNTLEWISGNNGTQVKGAVA